MRAVIQRVSKAEVSIGGSVRGEIQAGLVILLGVSPGDTEDDVDWLTRKVASMRIFADENDQMNRSVNDINGGVMVISQFTLFASTRKGTRPSFNDAAPPSLAEPLYCSFLTKMQTALNGRPVACGEFGAKMQIALVNDGPVTIIIDTRLRE